MVVYLLWCFCIQSLVLNIIIELKEIKRKVVEPIWEFDQRFKALIGRLNFQIPDEQNKEWFNASLLQHIRVPLMQNKIAS
jgi:hypothetical protein